MWWYNIFSEKEVVWWSTNQRTNTILDHFSPSPFLFIYRLCKNLQFCFKFQIALTKDCPDYLRAKTLGATVVSLEFVRNGLIDGCVPEQFENWVLLKTDDEIYYLRGRCRSLRSALKDEKEAKQRAEAMARAQENTHQKLGHIVDTLKVLHLPDASNSGIKRELMSLYSMIDEGQNFQIKFAEQQALIFTLRDQIQSLRENKKLIASCHSALLEKVEEYEAEKTKKKNNDNNNNSNQELQPSTSTKKRFAAGDIRRISASFKAPPKRAKLMLLLAGI